MLRLRSTTMELEKLRLGDQMHGLMDLINDLPYGITMVEIGCWQGESAELFLQSGKVNQFYAVDVWIKKKFQLAEIEFDKKTKGQPVTKLKMDMAQAIKKLPVVDFIYIDGNHSYESVKNDLLNSLQVIKEGGIIAGHDYSAYYNNRVVKAVCEVLGCPDKIYKDTSWLKYMPL